MHEINICAKHHNSIVYAVKPRGPKFFSLAGAHQEMFRCPDGPVNNQLSGVVATSKYSLVNLH